MMDEKQFLQETILGLNINTFEYKQGDEHLVLEINDEWIFRFAKNDEVKHHMRIEVALLKALENKIGCSIPRVAYYFPQNYCFGYQKINGSLLTKKAYAAFSDDQKNLLCHDIAKFLYELQNGISVNEARKMGLQYSDWPMTSGDLKKKLSNLDGDLKKIFDIFIDLYEQLEHDVSLITVVHNDLHGDNILIDPLTSKLVGIIDFSSASIGSVYHEFRYLHLIDPNLVAKVADTYSKISGKQVNIKDAYVYCLATEFSRWVQANEQNNSQKREEITQRIMKLSRCLEL